MNALYTTAAALIGLGVIIAGPAHAAELCDTRDAMQTELAKKFGERFTFGAVTVVGTVLELLVAPDNGTWTLLESYPDDKTPLGSVRTCLRFHGTGWTDIEQPETTDAPEYKILPPGKDA